MSETTIAILNQYPPDKFNVLAPETITELSPWHQITISQVKVNPAIPQGELSNGQVYKVSGGKLAPHKETVLRLADAAGAQFKPTILKRHDDGSFEAASIVERQDPDGTWRQYAGSYFWNVPERIAQVADQNSANGQKEVKMIRKFAAERAESGAMLRAVRGLIQLKGSYTAAELSRPFIVARVSFNPWHDPEIARMYRAAISARLAANLDALRGPDDGGDPFGIEAPEQMRRITAGQAAAATDMLETMGAIPASGNGEKGGPIWGDDIVQAGEEPPPAPPEPEPQRAAINVPTDKSNFFSAVQEATNRYYRDLTHHLFNSLDKPAWPGPKDQAAWDALYVKAIQHADKRRTEEAIQVGQAELL